MSDTDVYMKLIRIEEELEELARRVERLEQALYGNSREGIAARLSALEAKVAGMEQTLRTALVFSIGTFLGIIVTIVVSLLR